MKKTKPKSVDEMMNDLKDHIDYICPSSIGWTISLNELEDSEGYDQINEKTIKKALEKCYIKLRENGIEI